MQHTHAQLKRYNHLLGELEAVYHDLSYQLGMSDSVSKILYTLCCEGSPCRISDICLCSGLSKQTVNSALRKLEAQGLIYLESAGRKAKTVCLTEDGTRFAQKTALGTGGSCPVHGSDGAVFIGPAGASRKALSFLTETLFHPDFEFDTTHTGRHHPTAGRKRSL